MVLWIISFIEYIIICKFEGTYFIFVVYVYFFSRTLKQSEELNYFDLKLLFAITTFCSEIRYKVREELHGVSYLLELLNAIYDKELKKSANLRVYFKAK